MSRSKIKEIEDMTVEELHREHHRCIAWLGLNRHPQARKSMIKRIRKIEALLEDQQSGG